MSFWLCATLCYRHNDALPHQARTIQDFIKEICGETEIVINVPIS